MITDAHTHRLRANAVVNFNPTADTLPLRDDMTYSVGIHPWDAARATDELLKTVEKLCRKPNVVAVGETGLDFARPVDAGRQKEVFEAQVKIALHMRKPIIIHAVKAWQQLIEIKQRLDPDNQVKWVIHGFRGKPQLARQLLRHGFYLSFGVKHNPESFAVTPPERRLVETDESDEIPPADADFSSIFLGV